MTYVKGLRCVECGREYKSGPLYVCEFCFGPLEVTYDYAQIRKDMTKQKIESRPNHMWRYRELLPIDGDPVTGFDSGFTPLVNARNLAGAWGVKEIYLKDDSVNHPTLSFKDRVVAVAVTKAREFGFDTVACASTGNLANSLAALAARSGVKRFIFTPSDLEYSKIIGSLIYQPNLVMVDGDYDEVNRLCSEIADKYQWAFVNINLRPFYGEGSKSMGFEIAEQLGWKTPDSIVAPSASGSLLTKLWKSFQELELIGLVPPAKTRVFAAQAAGCNPIITAIREGSDIIRPVKPRTVARSIAIGNPGDGYYAAKVTRDSGGYGADATDEEIVDAMQFLAETEGMFVEPAGGATVAAAKKLVDSGRINRDGTLVLCITGNGLKTSEAIAGRLPMPAPIKPNIESFEELLKKIQ
ncbi:MAG TPA: threonine synthase [Nitrospirota bacterium]|nr:threonine synthase [Nitrospirota bacterium]